MKRSNGVRRGWRHLISCSIATAGVLATGGAAHADEHLFGYARGTETLPSGRTEFYQFTTLRSGKQSGTYEAWDFETEIEHGFSDKLQASLALTQHGFRIRNVPDQDDANHYRFGGFEASAKYRFASPFKDGYGLAVRPEIAVARYDDVAGLLQHELLLGNSVLFQRNGCDDTLIFVADAGFAFTWGKQPAEQYDHELLLDGLVGLSYRFASNWFIGAESRIHAEYPHFDLSTHEHSVVFFGPALHYGGRRWWATLSYAYQVWGNEVDAAVRRHTYAEETRNEYRLKFGLNF